MDFSLDESLNDLKMMVRAFTQEEVEPKAKEIDSTDKFPHDLMARFKQLEIFGLPYPKKYGGTELGYLAMAVAVEELAKGSSVVAGWLGTQCNCMEAIYRFGTEDQKNKYLKPLARGQKLGCFAFTEPSTGSDPKSLKTRAQLEKDHYVLNGQKTFITRASVSDVLIVFAKTSEDRISAFIVETGWPGYSVSTAWEKMGSRGSDTCDVYLENMRVPKSNLLGKEGEGYKILLSSIAIGKIAWSAQGTGMAAAALDEAVKYSKNRTVKGRPASELLNIQWLLAEINVKVEACRLMTYKTAWLKDQGEDIYKAVAMTKFFSSVYSVEAISQALQVHGSYGYIKDYKVERLYRDSKLNHVIEGSLELQRVIIANELLKGVLEFEVRPDVKPKIKSA